MGSPILTAEENKRYDELWEEAVSRYLDRTDWDISEWLDDDEWKEYQKLQAKIDGREDE